MNKILSLGARAACAMLFPFAVACASNDGPSDPPITGERADDVSVTRPSFVSLRRDMRKCMAPLCGGYFVRDVNLTGPEVYVSGLDMTGARLPADVIEDIRTAPTSELVLYGHLGLAEPRFRTRPFVVLEGYRGMPGIAVREGDAFYKVHARKDPIACLVAPCPNEMAARLNTTSEEAFDRVAVERAAPTLMDKAWLTSRVLTHDAIAAGALTAGEHFPGGYEQVLDASQVFVRLPDRIGPCPERPTLACQGGLIAANQRTADRCIVPVACVRPTVCPQFMVVCQPGYTLASWAATPNGCPAFACDPSFLAE